MVHSCIGAFKNPLLVLLKLWSIHSCWQLEKQLISQWKLWVMGVYSVKFQCGIAYRTNRLKFCHDLTNIIWYSLRSTYSSDNFWVGKLTASSSTVLRCIWIICIRLDSTGFCNISPCCNIMSTSTSFVTLLVIQMQKKSYEFMNSFNGCSTTNDCIVVASLSQSTNCSSLKVFEPFPFISIWLSKAPTCQFAIFSKIGYNKTK